jgi:putative copper resistance protein D
LLRDRRQDLHFCIARSLENQFADLTAVQPELLAHHYAAGGSKDKAIKYWREAGEHLAAASAWFGGLIGLPVLFVVGRHRPAVQWAPLQLDAIRRFSSIGVASVATLICSGIVNAWILVGSFRALLVTDYGQLLLLKLAVFAAMVAFATINRLGLTPLLALAVKGEGNGRALSALAGNTWIEFALAVAIFAIVGVLGTLHPAIHLMH